MKAVIYYEGLTERQMFDHILQKWFPSVHTTEDFLDFENYSVNNNAVLFYDCYGAQNVFPQVARTPYIYKNDEIIVLVRDLEETPCFSQLKTDLSGICTNLPYPRTRLIFSKPGFEQVYFADLSLFQRVFCEMHEINNGRPIPDQDQLQKQIDSLNRNNPGASIKKLFTSYNMAFDKPRLAKAFFDQFDCPSSEHTYIKRVMTSLEGLTSIN